MKSRPAVKSHLSLESAIQAALGQADTYDREVYEHMGVKTIWIEDWPDIAAVLDAIPTSK